MVNLFSLFLLFLYFQPIELYGQNKNPDIEIENYITASLIGEAYNLSSDVIKNANPQIILRLASNNISNTNNGVRYRMIDLVKRKALTIDESDIKTAYISFLIEAIKDKDSGNSGVASKSLTNFHFGDFNRQSKDSVYMLLTRTTYHYENIIKLNGFLKTNKAPAYIKNRLTTDSTLSMPVKWAYNLALARMGDETSIRYCLDKVKSAPKNESTVSYLYPDLIYIRQPVAVKYLVDQIMSDSKDCNVASPESDEKTICAFKIMAMLAPVIENFPIKADKYGDLEIDNYDEALVKVRNWISGNPDLIISNEIY